MRSANNIRTGLTAGEIKQAFHENLCCGLGRLEAFATKHDLYVALALTIRDRVFQRTVEKHAKLRWDRRAPRCLFVGGVFARTPSREPIRDYCERVWKIQPAQ